MGLEDDFLLADADDEKTIEFIKNYLPQELKRSSRTMSCIISLT